MKRILAAAIAVLAWASCPLAFPATAHPPLVIKKLAQKKVSELPPGPLYWRIENFDTVAQARADAGPWSLVAESGGKVWLFSLGSAGAASPNGHKVAEVGPIARVAAPQYILRINDASGPPGSMTKVHSHPGSEAFYVLQGEQSIHGPHGVLRVEAGQPQAGQGAGMPMQVSSTGATSLHALVMFVVDAGRPFSSPAKMP